MAQYSRVRFIGYAIPTTPADMVAVGDPDGTGAVAGTYRGAEDFDTDIAARALILKSAVDTARAALPDGETGVLNVFVAPEFYWHGPLGPYVHAPGTHDPGEAIMATLARLFPIEQYPDFLFVMGTAITSVVADIDVVLSTTTTSVCNSVVRALGEAWQRADGPLAAVVFDTMVNFIKNAHAYPQVEVRNRAFVLGPQEFTGRTGALGARELTTEKYFDSNEDFLLWDVTGRPVITEQMCAYPVLDTSAGDAKAHALDPHAIFALPGVAAADADAALIGVEICLDHADHRMRKAVDRTPWPNHPRGVDLHLIPSCGMQLHASAVAARAGGWAFNCDGQYVLGDGALGTPGRGCVGDVESIYTDYRPSANSVYGAHTQLAQIRTPPQGAGARSPGSSDAAFASAPDVDVTVIEVPPTADLDDYFAGGAGAVHIYGAHNPLPCNAGS